MSYFISPDQGSSSAFFFDPERPLDYLYLSYPFPLYSLYPLVSDRAQSTGNCRRKNADSTEESLLPAQYSGKLVETAVNTALDALDVITATPVANVNAGETLFGHNIFDDIKQSHDAKFWHGSIVGMSVISLFGGVVLAWYRKSREKERDCDFFFAKCVLKVYLSGSKENKNLKLKEEIEMGIEAETLREFAYFFPSEEATFFSMFRCWVRRLQADKKKIEELVKKIEDIALLFLNKQENQVNRNPASHDKFVRKGLTLRLTNNYKEKLFSKPWSKKILSEIQIQEKQSLVEAIKGIFNQVSFVYWLAVFTVSFIFIFTPAIVIAVNGVALFPLAIVGVFCLFGCLYQFSKKSTDEKTNVQYVASLKEEILGRAITRVIKIETFLKFHNILQVKFSDSKLYKTLQEVLANRSFGNRYAEVKGFSDGFFSILFQAWFITDLATVLLSYLPVAINLTSGPLGVAITIVTLILGTRYGRLLACEEREKKQQRYKNLEDKIKFLNEAGINIPNLELSQFDRLERRLNLEEPVWTRIKKCSSRIWVVIKKSGTGSLFFRLAILGTVKVIWPAVAIASALPYIAIPLIILFAAASAIYHYRAYNTERKLERAENAVDYLYNKYQIFDSEQANTDVVQQVVHSEPVNITTPKVVTVNDDTLPKVVVKDSKVRTGSSGYNSHNYIPNSSIIPSCSFWALPTKTCGEVSSSIPEKNTHQAQVVGF